MADLQYIETPGDYKLRNGASAWIFAVVHPWAAGRWCDDLGLDACIDRAKGITEVA
jgi:hypothetical protein